MYFLERVLHTIFIIDYLHKQKNPNILESNETASIFASTKKSFSKLSIRTIALSKSSFAATNNFAASRSLIEERSPTTAPSIQHSFSTANASLWSCSVTGSKSEMKHGGDKTSRPTFSINGN